MAEATTAEAPSYATRKTIVQVTDRGIELEREVEAFAIHAQEAKDAFNAEVDPLHLPDEQYALVTGASGLSGLLDTARRMQEVLHEVVTVA